jgi:probable rRNA maturation factor
MTPAADTVAMPEIDVLVEAGTWGGPELLHALAERAIGIAMRQARPPLVPGSELSLVFSDDAHVRILNHRYRGKDSSTNVLSFPAPPAKAGYHGPLLGDVVLAEETVAREASEQGLAFEHHLTHLIVHGFLHLLGYDHETDAEAAVMEGMETRILAQLGIADPYGPDPRGGGGQ